MRLGGNVPASNASSFITLVDVEMDTRLRILYVGSMEEGGTCSQRARALVDLGHHVDRVDTSGYPRAGAAIWVHRAAAKLSRACFGEPIRMRDQAGVNVQMRKLSGAQAFDLVWIDKGLTVEPETLRDLKKSTPACVIVGYSPDDMAARHCQSRQFLEHLHLYNIFFTTKSYNVGCPRVEFIGNAFDPHSHAPVNLTSEERKKLGGPLGFVGTWEPERNEYMYRLALEGIPVRIWGSDWNRSRLRHSNLSIEMRTWYGEMYAKALCAFDINLCFLRKLNRDLQTTRSVEIPACGKFMLAERTDEHRALFQEGTEAEYFSAYDELSDKVKYYLAHPAQRERIAKAGFMRAHSSGYSNHSRMREMLATIALRRKD